MSMDNTTKTTIPMDCAAEVKAFRERYGMSAEAMLHAVSVDENKRRIDTLIPMGVPSPAANAVEGNALSPQLLSRVQRALFPDPSRRYNSLLAKRVTTMTNLLTPVLIDAMGKLRSDLQSRPRHWLRFFVEQCDQESALLEKMHIEAQAKLRQANEDLKPIQAQLGAVLKPGERHLLAHLIDVATELFRWVDRGVGLTGLLLEAERLCNEREARAFDADAASGAKSVMQELRGLAQAERDTYAQFAARLNAVQRHLVEADALARARLSAHPYADVDLTSLRLLQSFIKRVNVQPGSIGLDHLFTLDEQHLYEELHGTALEQTCAQLGDVSLLDVMQMEADDLETKNGNAPGPDSELVAQTLEAAYQRTADVMLPLQRQAAPRDLCFVGVEDETNAPFQFSNATLVGTRRRDQIQFAHLQVGIALDEVTAYAASREPFEQASRQRNYYVLDTLAVDDHARQVFALALASGLIEARDGALAICGDGTNVTALGATVEGALNEFCQQENLVAATEARVNQLPLAVQIQRLDAYLARGQSDHVTDDLWWEFASYVDERLKLAREQSLFLASSAEEQRA